MNANSSWYRWSQPPSVGIKTNSFMCIKNRVCNSVKIPPMCWMIRFAGNFILFNVYIKELWLFFLLLSYEVIYDHIWRTEMNPEHWTLRNEENFDKYTFLNMINCSMMINFTIKTNNYDNYCIIYYDTAITTNVKLLCIHSTCIYQIKYYSTVLLSVVSVQYSIMNTNECSKSWSHNLWNYCTVIHKIFTVRLKSLL